MAELVDADHRDPASGSSWTSLSVSYCQYEVTAVPGASGMGIYMLGDDLVHVVAPYQFTGFCGIHTGWIDVRVRVLPGPPAEVDSGWDAISEASLWSPSGRLSVIGLMGGTADALTDIAVPRGLIRVRVHARNRLHESVRTDDDPPEQHELHIWAVSEETPWRTVLADPGGRDWEQKPTKAAEWAILSLVPRPSGRPTTLPPDPYEDDAGLPRVTVVRHRPAPVEVPDVLPAGDLEARLERVDDETLLWSWSTADEPLFPRPLVTLPDDEPSTVRLMSGPDGFTLRHEGVLGRHALALGLIWDHLLDSDGGSHPWMTTLREQAAEATALAEKYRRLQAERDAKRWGGAPPSDRVRRLFGQAASLARIDRRLLDRVDALPAARQREVACWAARRAMRVAGLEQIGWIVDALADAEADHPLPRSFTEQGGAAAFRRLLSDPEVPHTTVRLPLDPEVPSTLAVTEMLQQAAAFPALLALANDDPLAAAIDAVYNAAIAHGTDRDHFLADAHTTLG
ncbi:hypothetical protein O7634_21710 [Micromonospora sp. WMMD1120]|uniref:hypothetical protein n=1 Tax=Micromonospora sp. WMMD1120 TaxID=3016106 RepID=UPI0024168A4F|nr:hypothetical protein [Micromonospora sp. WMMD1120]MDG4809371.1 hypothetical protein [Micromonospora sp. WMMD1120]